MEDLEQYLKDTIEPTVADFRSAPTSIRLGFLACVVIDHAVDYLAFPADKAQWDNTAHRQKRVALRENFRNESWQFKLVSDVANAFKHVKTTRGNQLEASQVHARSPAIYGRAIWGDSLYGDATGAVIVEGRDLLPIVCDALEFLYSKTRAGRP